MRYFAWLSNIEGSSLLLMMFVAMPLRAITKDPMPTRYLGLIHGLLFLMFLYTLLTVAIENRWGVRKSIAALIMGSVPFGSFFILKMVNGQLLGSKRKAARSQN